MPGTTTTSTSAILSALAVALFGAGSSVVASAPPTAPTPPEQPDPSGLLTADELGLPPEWTIRDADAATVATGSDDQLADLDPFLGLLDCPDGTIVEQRDGEWLSRRYAAPELPLDNGILSAEITIEAESATDAATDIEALQRCSVGDLATLDIGSEEIGHLDGEPIEAATLELLAAPSERVPYPSAFNAAIVPTGSHTVTVVLGGIDMGESWQQQTSDLAALAIDDLLGDATLTPTTSSDSVQPSTP